MAVEKETGVEAQGHVPQSLNDDATDIEKSRALHNEDFHGAAERGHAATDQYVLPIPQAHPWVICHRS